MDNEKKQKENIQENYIVRVLAKRKKGILFRCFNFYGPAGTFVS